MIPGENLDAYKEMNSNRHGNMWESIKDIFSHLTWKIVDSLKHKE